MEIEDILTSWVNESLFGKRFFEKKDFSLFEGQDLYLIWMSVGVTVAGVTKKIEKHIFFQTNVQGITDDHNLNPKGDEYVCKQILSQLEDEFFQEYNSFINDEINKKTSP